MTDEELKEIEEYEDFHTHVENGKDSKGRKHHEFIYQDYHTVDGFFSDDGFDTNEIMYRKDYLYFENDEGDIFKKSLDNDQWYKFTLLYEEPEFYKRWLKIKDKEEKELKKISFEKVLSKISKKYYGAYEEKRNNN